MKTQVADAGKNTAVLAHGVVSVLRSGSLAVEVVTFADCDDIDVWAGGKIVATRRHGVWSSYSRPEWQ